MERLRDLCERGSLVISFSYQCISLVLCPVDVGRGWSAEPRKSSVCLVVFVHFPLAILLVVCSVLCARFQGGVDPPTSGIRADGVRSGVKADGVRTDAEARQQRMVLLNDVMAVCEAYLEEENKNPWQLAKGRD